MKNVCVFHSHKFDPDSGWDEAAGIRRFPAGQDCAEHVSRALAAAGVALEAVRPVKGDTAWFLYPQIGRTAYELMVSFATSTSAEDQQTFWTVPSRARCGRFGTMFTRRPFNDVNVLPLREALVSALAIGQQSGVIHDVAWMSERKAFRTLRLLDGSPRPTPRYFPAINSPQVALCYVDAWTGTMCFASGEWAIRDVVGERYTTFPNIDDALNFARAWVEDHPHNECVIFDANENRLMEVRPAWTTDESIPMQSRPGYPVKPRPWWKYWG